MVSCEFDPKEDNRLDKTESRLRSEGIRLLVVGLVLTSIGYYGLFIYNAGEPPNPLLFGMLCGGAVSIFLGLLSFFLFFFPPRSNLLVRFFTRDLNPPNDET